MSDQSDIEDIPGCTGQAVKRHLESVFRKVQVTTRSAAALYAVRHGLLSPLA